MKKFTLLFCLFAATTAQAQTKEEAIQWVHEYGSSVLGMSPIPEACATRSSYKIHESYGGLEIKDGYIKLEYGKEIDKGNMDTNWTIITFRCKLSDLFIQDIPPASTDGKGYPMRTTKVNYIRLKATVDSCIISGGSSPSTSWDSFFIPYCGTREGAERVAKAIIHLAKLHGAKELPKVTKNTF
jgi:hypothetical protein